MFKGLRRILNDGNGQDLAAVALGVNESGSKLVDVISLLLCSPPKHVLNHFRSTM